MLIDGTIREGINHLRVGEAFLIGRETSTAQRCSGLYEDVFTLRAEVVELRRKPSVPAVLSAPMHSMLSLNLKTMGTSGAPSLPSVIKTYLVSAFYP